MSPKLKKILLGIRSQWRLFRVFGLGGVVVDSLLDLRGTNGIDEDYFEQISISRERDAYELLNEDKGNKCTIGLESIVLSKKSVDNNPIDVAKFQRDTLFLYKKIREVLELRELNRIGIIYEFETGVNDTKNVNKFLQKHFLHFEHSGTPSNFAIKLAFKMPSKNGIITDDVKDYYNIITQFGVKYDEKRNPIEDMLFIAIDIQRYFYPPTSAKTKNLIENHFSYAETHIVSFIRNMREKGLELG